MTGSTNQTLITIGNRNLYQILSSELGFGSYRSYINHTLNKTEIELQWLSQKRLAVRQIIYKSKYRAHYDLRSSYGTFPDTVNILGSKRRNILQIWDMWTASICCTSGFIRCVILEVLTIVSKERTASIFRVDGISGLVWKFYMTSL